MTLGVMKLARIAKMAKTPMSSTNVKPGEDVRREAWGVEGAGPVCTSTIILRPVALILGLLNISLRSLCGSSHNIRKFPVLAKPGRPLFHLSENHQPILIGSNEKEDVRSAEYGVKSETRKGGSE